MWSDLLGLDVRNNLLSFPTTGLNKRRRLGRLLYCHPTIFQTLAQLSVHDPLLLLMMSPPSILAPDFLVLGSQRFCGGNRSATFQPMPRCCLGAQADATRSLSNTDGRTLRGLVIIRCTIFGAVNVYRPVRIALDDLLYSN